MPGKEVEAARPGDIRTGLVVAWPFVAMEAMLRARIDVDLDIGPLGGDGLDIAAWSARRLFGVGDELARHCNLIRRIAGLEIALDGIEDRRRDGDVTAACEAIADRTNVVIDAKDFLDHHHRRLGRGSGVG